MACIEKSVESDVREMGFDTSSLESDLENGVRRACDYLFGYWSSCPSAVLHEKVNGKDILPNAEYSQWSLVERRFEIPSQLRTFFFLRVSEGAASEDLEAFLPLNVDHALGVTQLPLTLRLLKACIQAFPTSCYTSRDTISSTPPV